MKDVIISGGTRICPRDVEEVLARHPEGIAAAVVGVADRESDERVKACVVLSVGSTAREAELKDRCRVEMVSFKKPSFHAFLPKTAYGKALKPELRQLTGVGRYVPGSVSTGIGGEVKPLMLWVR
ncbi:hypothetical protein [Pseudooceanicola sp.]|uniref:AMP-binding enzyme n=1 Tax=Pseudooceanicola sp. TaxID=1914328 RepID=UPI00260F3EA8|nr:hypothetical protein [Pseudooceanicola sp.]MDF1855084.1 hypothetical protein [Pseudooceanicola sp.]